MKRSIFVFVSLFVVGCSAGANPANDDSGGQSSDVTSTAGKSGATCAGIAALKCGNDLYCAIADADRAKPDAAGVCAPLPSGVGASCKDSLACAGGTRCDTKYGATELTCVALPALGQRCDGDANLECAAGLRCETMYGPNELTCVPR